MLTKIMPTSIAVVVLILIGVIVFAAPGDANPYLTIDQSPTASAPSPSTTPIPTPSPSLVATEPAALPSPSATAAAATTTYYPMTRYDERRTNRWYGKRITEADSEPLPCGFPFTGYHTGDDLEVFTEEINTETPIFAIADGTVRSVEAVSGYGGLVVVEHRINDEAVTGYYGHISLADTSVKAGDTVVAGQQITNLGDHCTGQAGGERKHLHFSIRHGSTVDVRGYADAQSQLGAWINPQELLKTNNARTPR